MIYGSTPMWLQIFFFFDKHMWLLPRSSQPFWVDSAKAIPGIGLGRVMLCMEVWRERERDKEESRRD